MIKHLEELNRILGTSFLSEKEVYNCFNSRAPKSPEVSVFYRTINRVEISLERYSKTGIIISLHRDGDEFYLLEDLFSNR